jgi:tetratricopeptide (TPR) repeat protein
MKKIMLFASVLFLVLQAYGQVDGLLAFKNDKSDYSEKTKLDSKLTEGSEVDAWKHIKTGLAYDQSSDIDKAIKEYGIAIEMDNSIAEAYDYRAVCYIKTRKYRKALSDLENAIDINSGFVEAYNHLGITHYWLKNYQDAINFYSRAIALNPSYATAYFNRAIVYLTLDENQLALKDLNKAKELKLEGVDPVLKEFFADKE